MSTEAFDVVFVGGGHNGLVAASQLARSGMRVVVLEAADATGGGAAAREIHPGFRVPGLVHVLPAFDRRAGRALNLRRHGLAPAPPVTTIVLLPEGGSLTLSPAPAAAADDVRRHSPADAATLVDFLQRLDGHAGTLRTVLETTPPRLDPEERRSLLALGRLAWSIRRRGRGPMRELLRIVTMNVADLLEDHFDSEPLKGAFALDAVLGTDHGPRSPNTVFTLLHRLAGRPRPGARVGGTAGSHAGPAGTIQALNRAAAVLGVDVRPGARVSRVCVAAGAARGVELAGGGVIEAPAVVSNADPVTTFVELVGADHLDADFLSEVRHIRTRGTAGKVSYALDRLPALPGAGEGGSMRWVLAPSIEYVEQAFDHVKYGESVPEPALEITMPSLMDPSLAPGGKHVMSVNVAYAPCSTSFDADAMGETVTALIERYASGFSATVLAMQAWGPQEIERRFGMRGGHWHHGDIALDQFFMTRPVPGFAQYRAPVRGLYLCGAGTHPGGGLTGTNGFNAAREILSDRRHGGGKS